MDVATITVGELRAAIRQHANLGDQSFTLLQETITLAADDNHPLQEVVDTATMGAFTLVIKNNIEIAKERVGNYNYLGPETWEKLGINAATNLPPISDAMLEAIISYTNKAVNPF